MKYHWNLPIVNQSRSETTYDRNFCTFTLTESVCPVGLVKHFRLVCFHSVSLLSHISLINVLLLSSAGIWLTAWHKMFHLFSRDYVGEEKHFFLSLGSSFFFFLLQFLPLVTFSCSQPFRPPASLSLTSATRSLTEWSYFSYASASIFLHMIEFPSESYLQGMDVTALIFAGINMSWLACITTWQWKLTVFKMKYNTILRK